MVFPLLKRWSYAAFGIVSTQRKDSKGSWPLGIVSKNGSSKRTAERSHVGSGFRKHRVQHPLSIPNDTAWGSDEAIVTVDHGGEQETDGAKGSLDVLHVVPEASGASYAAKEGRLPAATRGTSVSPGNILMVREWRTTEGHADPALESREVHVESGGSGGAQGCVVKLEDARRGQNMG